MLILIAKIQFIFLLKEIIWSTNQNIRFFVDFVETIRDLIIKTKQKFVSTSLTTIELFDRHKRFKNFVIRDYIDKINEIFKFRTLFFKDANNDHEFFVINFIITFDEDMFLEKVRNKMKYVILIALKENIFKHKIWNINFYHNF